ncbi:hypothetical protein J1N35_016305 [Gossypium stocksii]|uniref:Uncharacterized protein n=1 Tax=Gossypium stocksii TaxID=47602 RepID=A0A9D4A4M8_9ROSI|nr:hypothetical protein J1N35_016305 [Gossypium stocksii]
MEPDPFGWILEECRYSSPSDITTAEYGPYFGLSDSDSDSGSDINSDAAFQNPVNSTDVVILPALDISEDEEVFHTPPESRSTNASSDNCNNNDDPVIVDCEAVANSGRKSKRVTEEEENGVSKRLKGKTIESPAMSDTDTEELLEWFKNSDPSPEGTPETEIQNLQNHGSNFEVGEGRVRVRVSSHEGINLEKRVLPSWANPRVKGDEEMEIKETNLPPSVKGSVCDGERVEQETVHPSTASGPSRENHDGVNDVDVLLQVGKDCDDEEEEKLICVSILEVAEKKWGPF